MNTEATEEKPASNSTGERLRAAREHLGLTQQKVAQRLCLKLTTIRELEENRSPSDLGSTFVRGYIRSYARLVRLPEEELLPFLSQQTPVRIVNTAPMQSFSWKKRRKKRDGWLMMFTWLVLFVLAGLTVAWWWQNHSAAQDDLASESISASAAEGQRHERQLIPLNTRNLQDNTAKVVPVTAKQDATAIDNETKTIRNAALTRSNTQGSSVGELSDNPRAAVSPPSPAVENRPMSVTSPLVEGNGLPLTPAEVAQPTVPDAVLMNFKGDCWLEVRDSTGKMLFSGMQRSGGKLSLTGTAPYRLKIGAPKVVEIQYQGKPVDLSGFIRSNQVARLNLGTR